MTGGGPSAILSIHRRRRRLSRQSGTGRASPPTLCPSHRASSSAPFRLFTYWRLLLDARRRVDSRSADICSNSVCSLREADDTVTVTAKPIAGTSLTLCACDSRYGHSNRPVLLLVLVGGLHVIGRELVTSTAVRTSDNRLVR